MAVETSNELLLDYAIRHQIGLQRYSAGVLRRLVAILNRTDADLVAKMLALSPDEVTRQSDKAKRLEKMLDQVRDLQAEAYRELERALLREMGDLAEYETEFQAEAIARAVPVALDVTRPPVEAVRAAALARPFQGRLLKEWARNLSETSRARVRDAIRIGFVEGETIDQIVRRVRGTKANKYEDGILEINRRNAAAVVRTAVNHTAQAARSETWAANADLIKGVRWTATLDGRTSAVCRARDGQVFPVDKGPRPPAHWNCRSTMVPVLKSWRELGIAIDEAPEGTRASMDGQVPAGLNFDKWLRTKPREFQDEVLGRAKGDLFRAGVTMDRFVDRAGNELTLDQLRKTEGEAFKKAGL